jgi:hypothetical protein
MVTTESELVVTEEISSCVFHLSEAGAGISLCGTDIVPTRMKIEHWASIDTLYSEACRACYVKAYGWPETILKFQEHPLYVACQLMSLYSNWDGIRRMARGLKKKSSYRAQTILAAGVLVMRENSRKGPTPAIMLAEKMWKKLSLSSHDQSTRFLLRRIFTDFCLSWRNK